jgi:hypothetical protein
MDGETFLGRWARRKARHQRGVPPEAGPPAPALPAAESTAVPAAAATAVAAVAAPAVAAADAADAADGPMPPAASAPSSTPKATGPGGAGAPGAAAEPEPLPSIESLTPDSDFRPFMQAGVEPQARNAALRKLFSDPHFNQMDGLDIYIDDYGKPDPIPPAMLRALNQARTLRLFERDETAETGGASSEVSGQTEAPAPCVAEPEPQRPVPIVADAGADVRAEEPSAEEPSADDPPAGGAAAGRGAPGAAPDAPPAPSASCIPGAGAP